MKAGGPVMWLLLACSVLMLAVIIERFWSLQTRYIAPKNLLGQVWQWEKMGYLDAKRIDDLRRGSPLGRVLAAGLTRFGHDRDIIKESIEEAGRMVAHDLEKFLNVLATLASVGPLLGLFGTVIGIIKVFAAVSAHGVGDPNFLAGGISEALFATAGGLAVAIPSLIFYRYFRSRVDNLIVVMEQEAFKLLVQLHELKERRVHEKTARTN
jgi:biopolymer transport protein ExbB